MTDDQSPSGMTLHEAMRLVLQAAPNRTLQAPELAAEIERRQLYFTGEGLPAKPDQVRARAHQYPQLFDREGSTITLK